MSKRRTAEEVFNLLDPVKRFIDHGVSTNSELREASADSSRSDTTSKKVIELDEGRSASTNISSSLRHGLPDDRQAKSVDFTRTYAKATVQKTVRFQPRLIAELETYFRDLDTYEDKVSFQRIQNEALDLWLERHVRRSKKT